MKTALCLLAVVFPFLVAAQEGELRPLYVTVRKVEPANTPASSIAPDEVHVAGSVMKPGPVKTRGAISVLEAIEAAGGLVQMASRDSFVIFSRSQGTMTRWRGPQFQAARSGGHLFANLSDAGRQPVHSRGLSALKRGMSALIYSRVFFSGTVESRGRADEIPISMDWLFPKRLTRLQFVIRNLICSVVAAVIELLFDLSSTGVSASEWGLAEVGPLLLLLGLFAYCLLFISVPRGADIGLSRGLVFILSLVPLVNTAFWFFLLFTKSDAYVRSY